MKTEIDAAQVFTCQTFAHAYIENKGDGTFTMRKLPIASQIAPIFGMLTTDVNSDGYLDVISIGNSFATETSIGNYDAGKGMIFFGKGDGNFDLSAGYENGFFADQDGKGLTELLMGGRQVYIVSNNNGPSLSYSLKDNTISNHVRLKDTDSHIKIAYNDGRLEKRELYNGQSYLSQSSKVLTIHDNMVEIIVIDIHGETRSLLNPPTTTQ